MPNFGLKSVHFDDSTVCDSLKKCQTPAKKRAEGKPHRVAMSHVAKKSNKTLLTCIFNTYFM